MNRNFKSIDKVLGALAINVENLNCQESKTLSNTLVTLLKQFHYEQLKNEYIDAFKDYKDYIVKIKDKVHHNIDYSTQTGKYKDSHSWTNTLDNVNRVIELLSLYLNKIQRLNNK